MLHCGVICENFCGLRHLISAYRRARAPLFNSLTRKAELFQRFMMLDLADEHLHAAHLLTRANQMSLETASESFTAKSVVIPCWC